MGDKIELMLTQHRKELDESRAEFMKLQTAYNHLENEFRMVYNSKFCNMK